MLLGTYFNPRNPDRNLHLLPQSWSTRAIAGVLEGLERHFSDHARHVQAVRFFSQLAQQDVHFAVPMARALGALGDWEQAYLAMQKAIQSLPDNLEMHVAYAEMLLKEGRCEVVAASLLLPCAHGVDPQHACASRFCLLLLTLTGMGTPWRTHCLWQRGPCN